MGRGDVANGRRRFKTSRRLVENTMLGCKARPGDGSTAIGAYEAKTKFSELIARAERGESFVVTKNGRPVARLVPAEEQEQEQARQAAERIMARLAAQGLPCPKKKRNATGKSSSGSSMTKTTRSLMNGYRHPRLDSDGMADAKPDNPRKQCSPGRRPAPARHSPTAFCIRGCACSPRPRASESDHLGIGRCKSRGSAVLATPAGSSGYVRHPAGDRRTRATLHVAGSRRRVSGACDTLGCPLATRDVKLAKAATEAGATLFMP
jgi:prevent-host-death family protein